MSKRKTIHELKLAGTFRKDRHADRESALELPASRPDAPEWLSAAAKAEWTRILDNPRYAAAISAQDRAMLATYCLLWSELEAAGAEGTTASIPASRLGLFVVICGKLGLDPVSRGKIHAPPEKQAANRFDEIIKESQTFSKLLPT